MIRSSLPAAIAAAAALAGTMAPADGTDSAEAMTIVEAAREAGTFETLLETAESAGLVDALSGPGPFTVFAPTDAAFAALPEGMLEELRREENLDWLTAILSYHVAPTEAATADLEDGQSLETVHGAPLDIARDGPSLRVGSASVTAADIAASNGVIHAIDRVLMPPEEM